MSESLKTNSESKAAQALCLACGLCCNGVIFADVRLQPGDDPGRLRELGLPLTIARRKGEMSYTSSGATPNVPLRQYKLPQPCAALEGCRCRVYAERPKHCRNFECGVLQQVQRGSMQRRAAQGIIRAARAQVKRVKGLLRKLGDAEESLPLAARFRHTSRRLEKLDLDGPQSRLYGDLTLAFHDLNLLLSDVFYPGHNAHDL